jgi:hypothetical protein
VGGEVSKGSGLGLEIIHAKMGDEFSPKKLQTDIFLIDGFNLIPRMVVMAPKSVPTSMVQGVQRAETVLEPNAEIVVAEITVTFAVVVLVVHVPKDDGRVAAVAFSQLGVDEDRLLSIDRRAVAMIVAAFIGLACSVTVHSAYLSVFMGHPSGFGPGRGGQDDLDFFTV